jgi:serine/threonine protein phosphatase PrpC
MTWHFELASDIGAREEQQDRAEVLAGPDGSAKLAVLADGLGGHRDGAAAAQTVIDVARSQLAHAPVEEPRAFLTDLCHTAHEAISDLAQRQGSNAASTCVLLYVRGYEAYWAHVGDSRLYHFRGDRLLHRTRDHTLAEIHAQSEVAASRSTPRPGSDHRLYMCLGGQNDVAPEFGAAAVEEDDWFLLCSDGFWSQVGPEETSRTFRGAAPARQAAVELAGLAATRGGVEADNLSLVLAVHRPETLGAVCRRLGRRFRSAYARRGTG